MSDIINFEETEEDKKKRRTEFFNNIEERKKAFKSPSLPQTEINTADDITDNYMKSITDKLNADEEAKKESMDRYGVSLNADEYNAMKGVLEEEAKNKGVQSAADLVQDYALAKEYATAFNIPIEDAISNLDTYNANVWKEPQGRTGAWKSIKDAFTLGKNVLTAGNIGRKLANTEALGGDTTAIWEEYEALNNYNSTLQDGYSRNIFVEMMKNAAQTVPYTAAVAIPSMVTSAFGIGPVGGLVAVPITYGAEYIEMRKAGADQKTAAAAATLSSTAQTAIEMSLGNIAEAGAAAAGKITGLNKIASKVVARLGLKGIFKKAAEQIVKIPMDAGEEALEEFLQEIASSASYEVADLMQEGGVEVPSFKETIESGLEQAKGAFLGSLILGPTTQAVGYGLNKAVTFKAAKEVRNEAVKTDSKAVFVDNLKKEAKTQGSSASQLFAGKSDEEVAEAAGEIWENAEAEREANIRESVDVSEGAEERVFDEDGEVLNKGTEYRDEEGNLEIQEDTSYSKTRADGSEEGRLLVGDPTRRHSTEEEGNRYGYIDYEKKGNQVRIKDFKMSPGRENLATEFYMSFAEKMAGNDITWKPQHETNLKLKKELVELNPSGKKNGLNYFKAAEDVREKKAYVNAATQLRSKLSETNAKGKQNWTDEKIAAGVVLLDAFAKGAGMKLSDFIDKRFIDGQIVTDTTEVFNEKLQEDIKEYNSKGSSVYGMTSNMKLEGEVRSIIYASKNADFNTFVHELGHVARKHLTAEQMKAAEDFYKVEGGAWTEVQEEAFADDLTNYIRNGKAPSAALKELFEYIAELIKNIYRGLQQFRAGMLNEKITSVFDQIFDSDKERQKKAIEGTAEAVNKLNRRKQYEEEQKKQSSKNTEETVNTEEETENEIQQEEKKETTENTKDRNSDEEVKVEKENPGEVTKEIKESLKKAGYDIDRNEGRNWTKGIEESISELSKDFSADEITDALKIISNENEIKELMEKLDGDEYKSEPHPSDPSYYEGLSVIEKALIVQCQASRAENVIDDVNSSSLDKA